MDFMMIASHQSPYESLVIQVFHVHIIAGPLLSSRTPRLACPNKDVSLRRDPHGMGSHEEKPASALPYRH